MKKYKKFYSLDDTFTVDQAYKKGINVNVTRKTIRDISSPLYFSEYIFRDKAKTKQENTAIFHKINAADYCCINEDIVQIRNIIAMRFDDRNKNITVWCIPHKLRYLIKLGVCTNKSYYGTIKNLLLYQYTTKADAISISISKKKMLGNLKMKPIDKLKHGAYRKDFYARKHVRQALEHKERMFFKYLLAEYKNNTH